MNLERGAGNNKSCFPGVLISLFAGLAIGGILGILFAPKRGKETREDIKEKSELLIKKSRENIDDVIDKTKKFVDKSKKRVEDLKLKGEELIEKSMEKIDMYNYIN